MQREQCSDTLNAAQPGASPTMRFLLLSLSMRAQDVAANSQQVLDASDPYASDPAPHPALLLHARKPCTAETPRSLLTHSWVTPADLWCVAVVRLIWRFGQVLILWSHRQPSLLWLCSQRSEDRRLPARPGRLRLATKRIIHMFRRIIHMFRRIIHMFRRIVHSHNQKELE